MSRSSRGEGAMSNKLPTLCNKALILLVMTAKDRLISVYGFLSTTRIRLAESMDKASRRPAQSLERWLASKVFPSNRAATAHAHS